MKDIEIQRVIDQTDIISIINRFWFSLDTRDYHAMRSCLTNQINFDYSALGASLPSKADELVEAVQQDHKGLRALQHITTNHYVTINGDTAKCLANFQAQHFLPNERGGNLWTLGGRYTYSLRRTQDSWKIDGCVIDISWSDGNLQILQLAREQG